MPGVWRIVAACLAVGLTALTPGCSSSLTGGSIPPGGTPSRAAGMIVRADSPSVIVGNAQVRIVPAATRLVIDGTNPPNPPTFPDPGDGGSGGGGDVIEPPVSTVPGTVDTISSIRGEFAAEGIRTGTNRVVITPPFASGLQPVEYRIDMPAGGTYWLVAALLPTTTSLSGLTGIEVTPTAPVLRVGEAVQIVVRLLGGAPPTVSPSYLIRGDAARINPLGSLSGLRPGRADLRVIVGPYERAVSVVVEARN